MTDHQWCEKEMHQNGSATPEDIANHFALPHQQAFLKPMMGVIALTLSLEAATRAVSLLGSLPDALDPCDAPGSPYAVNPPDWWTYAGSVAGATGSTACFSVPGAANDAPPQARLAGHAPSCLIFEELTEFSALSSLKSGAGLTLNPFPSVLASARRELTTQLLVEAGEQLYSAAALDRRPHYLAPFGSCLAAATCGKVRWVAPFVPAGPVLGVVVWDLIRATLEGVTSARAGARGNVVLASGMSDMGMAGSGGLGVTGTAHTTSGIPFGLLQLIVPALAVLTAACQLGLDPTYIFGYGFPAIAIGLHRFVPGVEPYLGVHVDFKNGGQLAAGLGVMGLLSYTWQEGGEFVRVFIAGYPRKIADTVQALYHNPHVSARQEAVRAALQTLWSVAYPPKLRDKGPEYRPRSYDRLDHIASLLAPLKACTSFMGWPILIRATIWLVVSTLAGGDQAMAMMYALPDATAFANSVHPGREVDKGVCLRFVCELVHRVRLLKTCAKLQTAGRRDAVHARNLEILGSACGTHTLCYHRVQDAPSSRFKGYTGLAGAANLITAVAGFMRALGMNVAGYGSHIEPPAGDASALARYYAKLAAALPGHSSLTAFPYLVGLRMLGIGALSTDVWSVILRPPVERLLAVAGPVQLPVAFGGSATSGSQATLPRAGWTVRDYLEFAVSQGRPELLYYGCLENSLCEVNRWLEKTGWRDIGAGLDLLLRRANIKMTMWSGLPTLQCYEVSAGQYRLRWVPMAPVIPATAFDGWYDAGPPERDMWRAPLNRKPWW